MSEMFRGCRSLTSLDLSSFNITNVIDVFDMFHQCNSLLKIITPINTKLGKGELPRVDGQQWTDTSGNVYTMLPGNIDHSFVLTRGSTGGGGNDTSDIPSAGIISATGVLKDKGTTNSVASKNKIIKITLYGISKQIAAGKKIRLIAQGIPLGAPLPSLTWSTSNPKVATVTQTGVVTVKKKTGGKSVTITATATDGSGISASWKIKSMKGVVKKIAVTGAKTVKAGKSLKFKAKVTATKGANKKLKWTSSNTKYATVTSSGKVKTFKAGKGKKVKITAMATDGSNKKKTVTIKMK